MSADRLRHQIAFLTEVDRLKTVLRRTALGDKSRLENSAEHSWHVAMAAVVLAEHAPAGTDVNHAIRLLLVHDLVEIDAGDTFAFDVAAHADKDERERAAADRIFALLPANQQAVFRALWDEFETGETAAARFAVALDRLSGLLQNRAGGDGGTWSRHGVSRAAVERRMDPIRTATPTLWPFIVDVIEESARLGFFTPADDADRG